MNISSKSNRQIIDNNKGSFFLKIFSAFQFNNKLDTKIRRDYEDTMGLIEDIKKVKKEWMCANINFEYACGKELVDYYTYKIKASEVMYEYLLKQAKEKGVKLEML